MLYHRILPGMTQHIITVTSFKGGVGKTTTSIHLAGNLAALGQTVGVMDRDRTMSASSWARRDKLPFLVGTEQELMRVAGELDSVIIDSKGGVENDELRKIAQTSDFLILPTNVEYMSMDAMAQTAQALSEMQHHNYAVLFTMCPPARAGRPRRRVTEAREVLTEMGLSVLESTIRASDAFKDASEAGILVGEVKGNPLAQACAEDYRQAAQEILARIEAQPRIEFRIRSSSAGTVAQQRQGARL